MCNKQNPTWREGFHAAITDGGCWTLGSGEQVVFNEH